MSNEIIIIKSNSENLCSFAGNEYFSIDDAPKLKKFAESLGFSVDVQETDEQFCDWLNPLRRKSQRLINWNDWEVWEKIYSLEIQGKDYDYIAQQIGCPDAGHAIQLKNVSRVFAIYQRLDGKLLTPEKIKHFSKLIAKNQSVTESGVNSRIKKLVQAGCVVGKDVYPECTSGFNTQCFNCPHNDRCGKPIKDDIDIERYNEVWKDEQ